MEYENEQVTLNWKKGKRNIFLISSMYKTALDACEQPMTNFSQIEYIAESK